MPDALLALLAASFVPSPPPTVGPMDSITEVRSTAAGAVSCTHIFADMGPHRGGEECGFFGGSGAAAALRHLHTAHYSQRKARPAQFDREASLSTKLEQIW